MSVPTRVVLSCHHMLDFIDISPPMLLEDVWCTRCQKMREVVDAPPEWRVRCKRCPYARRLGAARLTAETRASKHANKSHHPVAIYNGRKLVYVVGEHYGEQDTPLFGDQAPF